MLTAFTLRSFKSFLDARVPLGPLTVLIGANASGKSNAIEGLRLLSWLASGRKLSSMQYDVQENEKVVRGRGADWAYLNTHTFELGCESDLDEWTRLTIAMSSRKDGLHITDESISTPGQAVPLYKLDGPSKGIGTDVRVAYNNFSRGGKKPHITCNDQLAIFSQLVSPARYENKRSQQVIPKTAKLYQRWLEDILFLDPVPARMRGYSFPADQVLRGDGSNTSSVLSALDKESSARSDILDFVQSLPEQDITDVDFLNEPRGGVMVKLVETFGGTKRFYDASLLSDGTLRVLAIAAAMLSAPKEGLVVIEEIDNGVHPSRARHLLEKIQSIAHSRSLRVLLSTHNPALLDSLPDNAMPDVVFCYRDPKTGSSRIVRLQEVPDFPELMAQGTLGHLMTSGTLERFVKCHPGSEERKKRALAWLNDLRSGEGG
ncbi:MAG: AAA family ATPase [Deltaproteobacteria bacterium]|nr:AAA family ATPase [Deltaproteobacteria bacterium]